MLLAFVQNSSGSSFWWLAEQGGAPLDPGPGFGAASARQADVNDKVGGVACGREDAAAGWAPVHWAVIDARAEGVLCVALAACHDGLQAKDRHLERGLLGSLVDEVLASQRPGGSLQIEATHVGTFGEVRQVDGFIGAFIDLVDDRRRVVELVRQGVHWYEVPGGVGLQGRREERVREVESWQPEDFWRRSSLNPRLQGCDSFAEVEDESREASLRRVASLRPELRHLTY